MRNITSILNEGTTNKRDADKFYEIIEQFEINELADILFNYFSSDEIEEFIAFMERNYEL